MDRALQLLKSLVELAFFVITGALLAGCAPTQVVKTEYLTQVQMLRIPTEFTEVKPFPLPPFTIAQSDTLPSAELNDLMFNYTLTLVRHIGEENKTKQKLIDWEAKQLLIYERKP